VPLDLERLKGHTVVLVSHPVPNVLESFRAIVESGALKAPRLAVVGVRHAKERQERRYAKSAAIAASLDWMHLTSIDCAIDAKSLFGENACSAEFRSLVERSSAVIFTGGADIPPALYGQKTKLTTVISTPLRQYWELSLLFHLLGSSRNPEFKPLLSRRPDYPVLGICMGMQAMNIAAGGTLHQDVLADIYGLSTFEEALKLKPEQLHRNPRYFLDPVPGKRSGLFHPIRFTAASVLGSLKDPPVRVMSIHHQSLDRLGQGLEVIATSSDGKVVEAVRHRRFANVLGVQFHPEYFYLGPERTYALPPEKKAVSDFHRKVWASFGRGLRPVGQ
jgi:putative glutamine amidotransferase